MQKGSFPGSFALYKEKEVIKSVLKLALFQASFQPFHFTVMNPKSRGYMTWFKVTPLEAKR